MSASAKIPKIVAGAEYFHQNGITGKNVNVAILDSGFAPHPDIRKERILDFHDYINFQKIPYDDYTHGTHVAGIIGSTKIGIAPGTNFIILKILDHQGDGSIKTFIKGIQWILQNHQQYNIRIVNISIGGSTRELKNENNILNQWVSRLWAENLVICCSAGNNGPNPDSITAPGNCRDVITVGSSDGRHFSSAGSLLPYITKPEIVAPGLHILSTKPYNGYQIKNGTSMSVPFVSGAIALLLQLQPDLTNEEIKSHLMYCAKPVPYLPYNMQGFGVLNLYDFLADFL